MFNSKRFQKIKNQSDVIFNSRFLQNLSPLERTEFLQYCHRRQYKEGEHIYYQGDPGTGMYFIEQGRVELLVEPEKPAEDENEPLSYVISEPESFGTLSIGYELRRTSSAKCLTDCTLMGFFKPDFETLKKRHPAIAVKFMETLAMVAMKQLERVTTELKKVSSTERAFSLKFESFLPEQKEESI